MTDKPSSDDTETGFSTIETTTGPLDVVRLYDHTWDEIQQKHPEFQGPTDLREMVEKTVANPTSVLRSRTRPNDSFVYVSEDNTYMGNACVVAVRRYRDTTSGNVRTAMFTDRPSGTPQEAESDNGE